MYERHINNVLLHILSPYGKLVLMNKTLCFLILCVYLPQFGFGYSWDENDTTLKNNVSLSVSYSPFSVLATNDFLRTQNLAGSPIRSGMAFSAEVMFQTTGKKYWHQLFNFPKYGFGLTHLSFNETDELGSPIAAYVFFESAIYKWKKSRLDWAFDIGFAFGWNAYNPIDNPYNTVLGAPQSIYANASLLYRYDISPRLGVSAGLGVSHASNGAIKMPNYGLNMFMPKVGVTYDLNAVETPSKTRILPPFVPSNEFSITAAVGTKQIDASGSGNDSIKKEFTNVDFTIYNVVFLYQRQVSRLSKVGVGIDFTVDPSDNADGLVHGDMNSTFPAPPSERNKIALVLSYELMIGKLSVLVQPGFYFYRSTHDPTPFFYQRIGAHYQVYKGIYVGTALRAVNFGQADWVEFSAGYKISF